MPELERLLGAVSTASRVTKYYPPGHPQIEETLGRVLGQLASLVGKGTPLVFSVASDGLHVGSARVFRFTPEDSLFRNLNELGVRELTLNPGIDADELLQLVEILTQDPRKIWEKGGLLRVLRQRKGQHISVAASDLSAAERQATLDSLRVVTAEERAHAAAKARQWSEGNGPAPTEDEIMRIVALLRDGNSFREIVDAPGPEGHDKSRIGALARLWGLVAKSGLAVSSVEAAIAAEIFCTDARTLMDAALDAPHGPPLPKLLERLDPEVAGDVIAARIDAAIGEAPAWLSAVDSLFRHAGTRRTILYRILQRIRVRSDAADTAAFVEDELVGGSREESAFLALMRGAQSQVSAPPASWSTRWGSGVLVRRATGLLERVGVSEEQRVRWLASELDRLIEQRDIGGVLEVLEAVRDRHSSPAGSDTPCVVSREAHRTLPLFLREVSPAERLRTIKALTSVDRSWRELVGRLLDLAEGEELRRFASELQDIGVTTKDLVWEIMRSENPEDIARAIRISGILANEDDIPVLLGFLQHGNPAVRMETIRALAHLAPRELLTRIDLVVKDTNPLVSMRGLEEIRGLPDAPSHLVDAVQKGLLRTAPEEIGVAVVRFIAEHGTPEMKAATAAAVLSPRLVGKTAPSGVRSEAAELLDQYRRRGRIARLTSRPGKRVTDA